MSISENKHDTLEQLIYKEGLRIKEIDFHPELDLMVILLNTATVLQESLSKYERLKNANIAALKDYELIGNGTGVHWKQLDEDLSLKGFLRNAIENQVLRKKGSLGIIG